MVMNQSSPPQLQEDTAQVRAPLSSPALGTGLNRLALPCGDTLRPAVPTPPDTGPPLALTLSGGGFRATLAGLGVVRLLADAGLLSRLRYVSSVSGGSIAHGVLARRWPELRAAGFTAGAVDRLVIDPVVDSVAHSSMKTQIVQNIWRAVGRRTRTDVLARTLDRRFFDGVRLEDLDAQCRWVFNAANLTTGVRFTFERDVTGDYVTGLRPTGGTGRTLASAVAASAAVPGAFAPLRIPATGFPCAARGDPLLLDGGAYDNLGLEAFDGDSYRDLFLFAMNAGGVLVTGRAGRIPVIRDLARSNSLLYRQSTGLRTRWMVDRFEAWEHARANNVDPPAWARQGVLFALATDVPKADAWRARYPEHRTWHDEDLAFVPTVFDRLDPALCRLLVYRGWWLTGAALTAYHPELLTTEVGAPPPL